MCAVIGFSSRKEIDSLDIELLSQIFLESKIRGKHATGIYFDGLVVSEPIPSEEFLKIFDFNMFEGKKLNLIGHCRYSTSDLRFNQPIGNEKLGIVHNGVISQEPVETWGDVYGLDCVTGNDSELILRSLLAGEHPLEKFKDSSIAAVTLQEEEIHFYRNAFRPLYYLNYRGNCWIASTSDILKRSFLKITGESVEPIECEPNQTYLVERGKITLGKKPLSKYEDKQVDFDCVDNYKSLADGL